MELQENIKPYYAQPFLIPIFHEPTFKKEVDSLVEIKVLKNINNSQWADPNFITKTKPFPIPNIHHLQL